MVNNFTKAREESEPKRGMEKNTGGQTYGERGCSVWCKLQNKKCGSDNQDVGGGCIEANHGFLVHVVDATMTEAYALKTGLQLAEHIGSNSFIVQSDCVQIVDTMKDDGFSATSAATIYD